MRAQSIEHESSRLFCRQWKATDCNLLISVEADLGFKAFCYPPSYDLSTEHKRSLFIETKLETYKKHQTCKSPVFLKSSNEFIGLIGIEPFKYKGRSFYELGYRLLERHWGQGYAREFSTVLIEAFFQSRPNERLGALVHIENMTSLVLTESLGFQREDQFEHNGSNHWWLSHKQNK